MDNTMSIRKAARNGRKTQWDDLEWLQIDPQSLPEWSEPKSKPLKKKAYHGDQ